VRRWGSFVGKNHQDALGPLGAGFQQDGKGVADLPQAGVGPVLARAVETIEVGGEGRFLPSREAAVAVVRDLLASGAASIDVGCFQVNLHYHPDAFASLDEAFDPVANALYAARFLSDLRARDGSWEAAVAAYHSATPGYGLPYRDRVLAAWNEAAPPPPPVITYGVRVITPALAGTAPGVIAVQPVSGLPVLVHGRT